MIFNQICPCTWSSWILNLQKKLTKIQISRRKMYLQLQKLAQNVDVIMQYMVKMFYAKLFTKKKSIYQPKSAILRFQI